MSIYKDFCDEKFDDNGRLVGFDIKYKDDFNFGYDVVTGAVKAIKSAGKLGNTIADLAFG